MQIEQTPLKHHEDEPPVYSDQPVRCQCPHCDRVVITDVTHSHTWISVLFFFILFLVLGIFALCVYPFVSTLTQDTIHSCPRCDKRIATSRRFSFPKISKEIITLKCGSCAIVLSKRYVLVFALASAAILCGSSVRWYVKEYGLPDIPEGPHIKSTWDDFLLGCGMRTTLGNPLHATKMFDNHFYSKTVEWDGRLNKVREGYFKKNFLFVNMSPHQQVRPTDPDLALMYNANDWDSLVADLEVGDGFEFNATLLELGSRGSPHLGVLRGLRLTVKNAELPTMYNETPYNFFDRPPIAHVPQLAQKVKELRRDFIQQRLDDPARGAFYANGDVVGAPHHLVVAGKKVAEQPEIEKAKGITEGIEGEDEEN